MARLVLLAIVVIVIVAFAMYYGLQTYLQRQRQKQLARYAPELLQYHNIPGPVAAMITNQAQQLEAASAVIGQTLDNNELALDPDNLFALEKWLDTYNDDPRRINQ